VIPPNKNWLRSMLMLRALVKLGARYAVLSPGSRNTPLAHSALLTEGLETIVDIDERSAAFVALGIARESNNPVILICTSGTAVANYFPALIEAKMTNVPLILLTADRPEDLQDCGAPQTIDQKNIFGKYTIDYLVLPKVAEDKNIELLIETIFDSSKSIYGPDRGPIQINCPYDEPLQPIITDADLMKRMWEEASLKIDNYALDSNQKLKSSIAEEQISNLIDNSGSIAIFCGPYSARNSEEQSAIENLAKRLNAPIIADITSNLRQLDSVVSLPELLLRKTDDHLPDRVLWFGGYPTSKNSANWLTGIKRVVRIQDYKQKIDPDKIVDEIIYCSTTEFCKMLSESDVKNDDQFLSTFIDLDKKAQIFLNQEVAKKRLSADLISVIRSVTTSLPPNSNLVLANSMSIRYVDYFCKPDNGIRVFGNKGANGIDGLISTSVGIAKSSGKHTLLITGDLAFLHDINALYMAAKEDVSLTILLLNNSGGGIFHHLPAKDGLKEFDKENDLEFDSFKTIHETPHSVGFKPICEGFGVEYLQTNGDEDFQKIFSEKRDVKVVEIQSSREETAKSLKDIFRNWKEQ
jgi:2-succinyl-5-enolpyruvyl-6-hydroxy-3-cyclohexene-1-carboxylate synthase